MPVIRSLMLIKPDEHVLIVGKNGSGKSHFCRADLMPRYAHSPIILDPKGEVRYRDYPVLKQFDPRIRGQIIRLPTGATWQDWDAVIGEIWERATRDVENVASPWRTIVADEMGDIVGSPQSPPPHLSTVLREGRRTHIAFWGINQRPGRLPVLALSEPQHYFVFRLTLKRDRDAILENTTDRMKPFIVGLHRGEFAYYHDARDQVGQFRHKKPIPW